MRRESEGRKRKTTHKARERPSSCTRNSIIEVARASDAGFREQQCPEKSDIFALASVFRIKSPWSLYVLYRENVQTSSGELRWLMTQITGKMCTLNRPQSLTSCTFEASQR